MERNRGGRPRHPDVLTPAEWRVLEALREGGTNAEIATRLGVSANTVRYHVSNMLAKLELRDRRALAAWRPERDRGRLGALLAIPRRCVVGGSAAGVGWRRRGGAGRGRGGGGRTRGPRCDRRALARPARRRSTAAHCHCDALADPDRRTHRDADAFAEPDTNALADGHRRTGADIDANTSTGGRHTRSW